MPIGQKLARYVKGKSSVSSTTTTFPLFDLPLEILVIYIFPHLNSKEMFEVCLCYVTELAKKLSNNNNNNNNNISDASRLMEYSKNFGLLFSACKKTLASETKIICTQNCVFQSSPMDEKFLDDIGLDWEDILKLNRLDIKKIKSVAVNNICICWVLTKDGKLFTNHGNKFSKRLELKLVKDLKNKKIIDLAAGTRHLIVLTADGDIYAHGSNDWGQCGEGLPYKDTGKFHKVNLENHKARAIAAGANFSMTQTQHGEILAWGQNTDGQLGIPNSSDQSGQFHLLKIEGEEIVKFVGGAKHSLYLTKTGKVYVSGSNECGQLGSKETHDNDHKAICFDKPTLVESLQGKNIVDIATGLNFSMVLTDNNIVYFFGSRVGCLEGTSEPTPIIFKPGIKIVSISAGPENFALLNSNGETYTSGNTPIELNSLSHR